MKNINFYKSLAIGIILGAGVISTTFAATSGFSAKLPAWQEDIEVSTIRKATNTNYFTLNIKSLGSGTDKVIAWAEGSWGGNYSSSTRQYGRGKSRVYYFEVPSIGSNVTLNLENPVKMSKPLFVSGTWSPN